MSEEEENLEDVAENSSSLPHTPPFGIRALRPGEDPNPLDTENAYVSTVRERPAGNWLAALVSSAGVVLSIIGTFLPWVAISEDEYQSNLIGWDQGGSAWIVLVFGFLAAGITSRFLNGSRNFLTNISMILFGTVMVVVAAIEMSEVSSYEAISGIEKSVGIGLPVILTGGIFMVLPSVFDKRTRNFRHKI